MRKALGIHPKDVEEAEAFNRKLARQPRFRTSRGCTPRLMQGLLRLTQIGASRRLARHGISVESHRVSQDGGQVRVRILRPAGVVRGVIIDIHGGGWVLGNAALNDSLNTQLINACDVAVVSVDYGLATNSPVEALIQECLTAAKWVLEAREYHDKPVIIIGESAGAHLAAATLLGLKSRQDFSRIAGALLYYGLFDFSGTPSVRNAGKGALVLDGPQLVPGLQCLTPALDDASRRCPPLSPLFGDLSGMPPALMFVGELDPLLDDTLMMAGRWGSSVPVELHRVPAAPHGYTRFKIGIARKTLARSHDWVKECLGAGSAEA